MRLVENSGRATSTRRETGFGQPDCRPRKVGHGRACRPGTAVDPHFRDAEMTSQRAAGHDDMARAVRIEIRLALSLEGDTLTAGPVQARPERQPEEPR